VEFGSGRATLPPSLPLPLSLSLSLSLARSSFHRDDEFDLLFSSNCDRNMVAAAAAAGGSAFVVASSEIDSLSEARR